MSMSTELNLVMARARNVDLFAAADELLKLRVAQMPQPRLLLPFKPSWWQPVTRHWFNYKPAQHDVEPTTATMEDMRAIWNVTMAREEERDRPRCMILDSINARSRHGYLTWAGTE